jgi:2'-5' RNA ligase
MTALPYPDAGALENHWWWRPGWEIGTRFYTWHVTVDDLPPLASHVLAFQEALRGFEFLDLIPREWMHITVQGVGHTRDVPEAARDAVVEAVAVRTSVLPAPTLTFARPVLHAEAVVIPPTDPGPLSSIREAIRAGIADAYGPPEGALTSQFRPHVSAAYVNAPAETARVRVALDAVDAEPVDVTITHVSLIELHRDDQMYEWSTVATVPLG